MQTLGRICAPGVGQVPGAPPARSDEAASGALLPAAERAADTPVRALEWPRGKPLRVIDASARSLKLTLRSARDRFMLDGELALAEADGAGVMVAAAASAWLAEAAAVFADPTNASRRCSLEQNANTLWEVAGKSRSRMQPGRQR